MKHVKPNAATSGDLVATADADKFYFHAGDGAKTIAGFDQAHDKIVLDWFGGYSDITYLGQLTDGLDIHTFSGGTIHVGVYDYDHNGTLDTVVSNDFGDLVAILDNASLFGYNVAGG